MKQNVVQVTFTTKADKRAFFLLVEENGKADVFHKVFRLVITSL